MRSQAALVLLERTSRARRGYLPVRWHHHTLQIARQQCAPVQTGSHPTPTEETVHRQRVEKWLDYWGGGRGLEKKNEGTQWPNATRNIKYLQVVQMSTYPAETIPKILDVMCIDSSVFSNRKFYLSYCPGWLTNLFRTRIQRITRMKNPKNPLNPCAPCTISGPDPAVDEFCQSISLLGIRGHRRPRLLRGLT